MSPTSRQQLVRINPHVPVADAANLIIIVPSIGLAAESYREEWPCNDARGWMHLIPGRLCAPTALLFFEHGLKCTAFDDWQELINNGKALLSLLVNLLSTLNLKNLKKRILFVTHGFGGFIVKSAFNQLSESADNQFLLRAILGIVFISCPHISSEEKAIWKRIPRFLLARVPEISSQIANPATLGCLATVCETFDECSQHIRTLVVCESAKTFLQAKPDNLPREQKLADLDLVRLPTCREGTIEIPASHIRILQLHDYPLQHGKILAFIDDVLRNTDHDFHRPNRGRRASFGHQDPVDISELVKEEERINPQHAIERLEERQRSTDGRLQHHHDPSPCEPAPGLARGRQAVASQLQREQRVSAFQSEVFRPRRDLNLPLYINNPGAYVSDFEGRDDILEKLETRLRKAQEELDTNPKGILTVALHGIGGIGKTSVAWAFARRCEDKKLFDLVLWTPADSRSKIVNALASAASTLGLVTEQESQDQEYCARQLRSWLQEPVKTLNVRSDSTGGATWLLILDNVDSLDIAKEFMPVSDHGSILFTTRDQIAASFELEVLEISKTHSESENNLEVPPFSTETSVEFMKSLSLHKSRDDEQILTKLAKELDGIPLVLRQVANIIRRRKMSPATFWEMYQDQSTHKSLFKEKSGPQTAYYEHNISTVWGLNLLEHGEELMRVIALMDPDDISESIFRAARDVKDKSTLGGFPGDLDRYSRAKEELYRSSLITDYEWQETIRVHRVVQATVRSQMKIEVKRSTFNVLTILLLQSWPESGEERGKVWKNNSRDTWPDCLKVRPHVTQAISHYKSLTAQDEHEEISTLSFARLLIFAGWYDHDRGLSPNAEELFQLSHQVCAKIHEVGDEIRAELHASQGAIATEMNEANKCLHHYQKFFDLTTKRFGDTRNAEDRINMAIAHNELGVAKMMMNRVNGKGGAFDDFRTSRALLADDINSSDERALRAWGLASVNLAFACWDREERERGIKTVKDLIEFLDRDPGFQEKDSLVYGRAYHGLGNLYEAQGKFHDAQVWHRKAYKRHSQTLGKDHHRTADVAIRLAMHYCRTNEFSHSHSLLDVAEKVFTTKLCYKPEKARCLHYRSLVLEKGGQTEDANEAKDRADKLFKEVMKERQEDYVPDSPIRTRRFDVLVTFWSR